MTIESNTKVIVTKESELTQAAKDFLDFCLNKKKFAFYGEIGAGKTTFIKQVCRQLGVEEIVTSPTYAIAHEYEGISGPVYHLDLYRLKNLEEALEINVPGYLEEEYYCFIEWPEIIKDLLPKNTVIVSFTVENDETRRIKIELPKE